MKRGISLILVLLLFVPLVSSQEEHNCRFWTYMDLNQGRSEEDPGTISPEVHLREQLFYQYMPNQGDTPYFGGSSNTIWQFGGWGDYDNMDDGWSTVFYPQNSQIGVDSVYDGYYEIDFFELIPNEGKNYILARDKDTASSNYPYAYEPSGTNSCIATFYGAMLQDPNVPDWYRFKNCNYRNFVHHFLLPSNPQIAAVHLRAGNSGPESIPNPHNFELTSFDGQNWIFAHNGAIDLFDLVDLIDEDGSMQESGDYSYINDRLGSVHVNDEPYETPLGSWPNQQYDVIDSNLYFIYLLKEIEESAGYSGEISNEDVEKGILESIRTFWEMGERDGQLNFYLINGENIWTFSSSSSYDPSNDWYRLVYLETEFFVTVASERLNYDQDWQEFEDYTLGIVSEEGISFIEIEPIMELEGKVVNHLKEPIINAQVKLTKRGGSIIETQTNENGEFILEDPYGFMPGESVVVEVSKREYSSNYEIVNSEEEWSGKFMLSSLETYDVVSKSPSGINSIFLTPITLTWYLSTIFVIIFITSIIVSKVIKKKYKIKN